MSSHSAVEAFYEDCMGFPAQSLPSEKVKTIEVRSFPDLGKLTAFRFIEWLQWNPRGVVSLPTGRTPEFFIKWTKKILGEWDSTKMQEELERRGLDTYNKPSLAQITFFQVLFRLLKMDEFFPLDPSSTASFCSYIKRFYIQTLDLNPENCFLMDFSSIVEEEGGWEMAFPQSSPPLDLSLRLRDPQTDLERKHKAIISKVDAWCVERESELRRRGGIGFFLGGLGPDGHVAFNVPSSSPFSVCRLTDVNYATQASAAGDLGGMLRARGVKVVTLGLASISFNPECVAIIFAAGEAKGKVVRRAVEGEEGEAQEVPSIALRSLKNLRFFVTEGAASELRSREIAKVKRKLKEPKEVIERVLLELCVAKSKPLKELEFADLGPDPLLKELFSNSDTTFLQTCESLFSSLVEKVERGVALGDLQGQRFLHTEPHHDDVILGYLNVLLRTTQSADNQHHFLCCTSGFNSVSDSHILSLLSKTRHLLENVYEKQRIIADWAEKARGNLPKPNFFSDEESRKDVWIFLDGVARKEQERRDKGEARRFLRNIIQIFDLGEKGGAFENTLRSQLSSLSALLRSGSTPPPALGQQLQTLKGACREWEAECVWGVLGWAPPTVEHLRLGFYSSSTFSPSPTFQRDVLPVVQVIRKVRPDILTVALDPEASGPDTHYKVLQAVTAAVDFIENPPETPQEMANSSHEFSVWGYRNVWYRFHPWEASAFLPVSLLDMSSMDEMFLSCFASQRTAEFPSPELDGPFCDLSRKVQSEQYSTLVSALGEEFFLEHPSRAVRACRGLVFLKEMTKEELRAESRRIRNATAEEETAEAKRMERRTSTLESL